MKTTWTLKIDCETRAQAAFRYLRYALYVTAAGAALYGVSGAWG